jgi:uncharacterized LabA/DUF88 family protein
VQKICTDLFGNPTEYHPFISTMSGASITSTVYDKVFYYDAVTGKEHGENQATYEARVQPEHDRFAKIQALDRVHIALGKIVGPNRRQKGVDVQLAVDMMTHAFRGNITKATLFAGDADFIPLIKALVGEGLHVTLWHPPQANLELKGAADRTRLFDFKSNYECLTADGHQPAFSNQGGGAGGDSPARDGLNNIVTIGEDDFAGIWQDSTLKIWPRAPRKFWSHINLGAPNATLARALSAFDAIYAWNIAATGAEWIET